MGTRSGLVQRDGKKVKPLARIDVTINGHNYRVACEDGQEDHLAQLAEYVDQRVNELVGTIGQVGESRLLVMSCLVIADELSEAVAALENGTGAQAVQEAALATATETLAERIETVAARLESP